MRSSRLHSFVGQPVSSVETPCLILNLDAFDANNKTMRVLCDSKQVRWRAHAKAHKSTFLAHQQILAGACGILVQKLGEAEVMVENGITDVFLSNEVIDERKLDRLAKLASSSHANLSIAVDSDLGLARLAAAFRNNKSSRRIGVLIDVNVGHNRTGCNLEVAVALAKLATTTFSDVVDLKGVHCYHGSIQHERSHVDRAKSAILVSEKAKQARDAIIQAVGSCRVVTGGGTGTLEMDLEQGVFTEVQPGSYAFMVIHSYCILLFFITCRILIMG